MTVQPTSNGFANVVSTAASATEAAAAVVREALEDLGGTPDLALIFASGSHAEEMDSIAQTVRRSLDKAYLLGATAESVVATGREIERSPAISLWLAKLPGVQITPMRLQAVQTEEGFSFTGWPEELSEGFPSDATMLLVADPFSFPADALLQRFNEDEITGRIFGGMASSASAPGENRLVLNGDIFKTGAAAVCLQGDLNVHAVVSQGCAPIGVPLIVTKVTGNLILELGGKPALARLQEIVEKLPIEQQMLVQRGIHVGVAIDEYRDSFGRGDFLIRNVIGADTQSGAIAIGAFVRVGQTIQFHVRDAMSADEDLQELLANSQHVEPKGALMFTCNGRGMRLFETSHHDAHAVQNRLGSIPLAGFFAAGEIGPIGGKHFLHGFTASIALFS